MRELLIVAKSEVDGPSWLWEGQRQRQRKKREILGRFWEELGVLEEAS